MPVLGSRGAWGRRGWQEGKSIHGLCLHDVQLSTWGKEDKALQPCSCSYGSPRLGVCNHYGHRDWAAHPGHGGTAT